jgi:hypothetical protein
MGGTRPRSLAHTQACGMRAHACAYIHIECYDYIGIVMLPYSILSRQWGLPLLNTGYTSAHNLLMWLRSSRSRICPSLQTITHLLENGVFPARACKLSTPPARWCCSDGDCRPSNLLENSVCFNFLIYYTHSKTCEWLHIF